MTDTEALARLLAWIGLEEGTAKFGHRRGETWVQAEAVADALARAPG